MAEPVTAPAGDAAIRPIRFAALQVPTFRWYWVTSWISSTGDGMENVIRGLLVVQLVGLAAAPFWLGMMVFAHWIPFTLFSLYGGALADRYDNRKVQIVAQLLLMTAAFGVATATLTGAVTVWWIFGMLLVHGLAGAIGGPAQQTLIHSIVGRDRLLSAVSLNSSARQLSQVVGPAIAGFIYLQFGPGWGFFVNGLTFVPLLVFLAFFIRLAPKAPIAPQAVLDALREGIAFVRSRPRIGGLIGVEMLPVIFLGHTFNSLLVLFATDYLRAGTLGYSFLLVASGLGALAAALWMAYARQRGDPAPIIVARATTGSAQVDDDQDQEHCEQEPPDLIALGVGQDDGRDPRHRERGDDPDRQGAVLDEQPPDGVPDPGEARHAPPRPPRRQGRS